MGIISVVRLLGYGEILLCVAVLGAMTVKRQWRDYRALGAFLAIRLAADGTLSILQSLAQNSADRAALYQTYFYVYWTAFAAESVLAVVVISSVFRNTLGPLQGLRRMGTLIFAGAVVVGGLVAIGSLTMARLSGQMFLVASISQMERMQSLLTLGLLLAVCLAIRPMGLTIRSRVFGVGLGLWVLAANSLVQSAWLAFNPRMNAAYGLINGAVLCGVLLVWAAYFVLPEPARGEIDPAWVRWDQRLAS